MDAKKKGRVFRMKKVNYLDTARRLSQHLSSRRRWQLAGLSILTVVSTFAELLSISAAFPFLMVLAAPERLFEKEFVFDWAGMVGINSPQDLITPLAILFCTAILLATMVRISMIWTQARLSYLIGIDFAVEMFERTLHQPYRVHAERNTSKVISTINGKSSKIAVSFILPSLVIGNAAVLLISAWIALLIVSPKIAFIIVGSLTLIYGIAGFLMRNPIRRNGEIISQEMSKVIQILQEGLGGIRDVLLGGGQSLHRRRYALSVRRQRLAMADNQILGAIPRFFAETLGIILIVCVAWYLTSTPDGLEGVLPLFGGVALGAQRLLPVVQQAYSAWSQIGGAGPAIKDCLAYLEQPYDKQASRKRRHIDFEEEIRLENVSLHYAAAERPALSKISLHIARGTKLGIIGPTGSGKSTLADILMGLISPDEGHMKIDNQLMDAVLLPAWQRHIAHVPQAIFLTDASLAENIAFGSERSEVDMQRLHTAIDRAQLTETIQALPHGVDTRVGERGVRLSGGQRQRIAIARALYREADVIVFDEATSALDSATEARVMEAVAGLDRSLTLIMIAHRLSTLKECDWILEIKEGRITREGVPADMLDGA